MHLTVTGRNRVFLEYTVFNNIAEGNVTWAENNWVATKEMTVWKKIPLSGLPTVMDKGDGVLALQKY